MLAKAAPQHLNLESTKDLSQKKDNVLGQKIWLPDLVYDSLPYFYLTAGFAAIFATLYISEWFWIVPHYLLFSAACLQLAYTVWRRRNEKTTTSDNVVDPRPVPSVRE